MAVEDKQHTEAVRSRIDMIVDAQETRAGDAPKKRKARIGRKGLIAILVSFCVIIAGLVVAILMVNRPWENSENANCGGSSNETAVERDERIRQVTGEIAAEANNMPYDEAISFLDEKLDEYSGSEYEFGVKMSKIYLLINNGETEEALKETKKINSDNLTAENLLDYYNAMRRIYGELGDDAMMIYYQDSYIALYKNIYDGGEIPDD